MFHQSVKILIEWLQDTGMDEELVPGIFDYLLARGTQPLSTILHHTSPWQGYAQNHDHLGWESFTEGRIATSLIRLQQEFLACGEYTMSLRTWSVMLIQHLLSITH